VGQAARLSDVTTTIIISPDWSGPGQASRLSHVITMNPECIFWGDGIWPKIGE